MPKKNPKHFINSFNRVMFVNHIYYQYLVEIFDFFHFLLSVEHIRFI